MPAEELQRMNAGTRGPVGKNDSVSQGQLFDQPN